MDLSPHKKRVSYADSSARPDRYSAWRQPPWSGGDAARAGTARPRRAPHSAGMRPVALAGHPRLGGGDRPSRGPSGRASLPQPQRDPLPPHHPERPVRRPGGLQRRATRSEEHTSELQSRENLVCRLLLEKKKPKKSNTT